MPVKYVNHVISSLLENKNGTQESVGLCQRILWVMPFWWINLERYEYNRQRAIFRARYFLWLAFVVFFVDFFYNKNAISWHGNAYVHGMLSWMFIGNHMNQLCFLQSFISISTRYFTTCYRDGNDGRQCRNCPSISKVYLIYFKYNGMLQTIIFARTV